MTRGQRLSVAIALAAVVLLAGRATAVIYCSREWYANLGALSVWRSHVSSAAWLYGLTIGVGVTFAWINISAVRRSVISLVVPTRVGNVEFGEEVPSARLRMLTAAVSICVAVVSLVSAPSWTTVALWRSGVVFAETDPYFTLDLGHFVAWLPLETAAYQWCFTLFVITAALVILLYGLTPSLSWDSRGLHVTPYARRHLSVLGAILLLFAAWGFRLTAFHQLITGSGIHGALTRIDHVWLIPTDLALSLVSVGAAAVLLIAGWMGQVTTAFASVTVVIAGALSSQLIGPWISSRSASASANARAEQPYVETRADFNARAFPSEPAAPSVQHLADSTLLANAGRIQVKGAPPDAVYPNARGAIVVRDPTHIITAPRLGSGIARLMHAWAEQNPRLLSGAIPSTAAFVRERDVRGRVAALAPIFTLSGTIGALPTARGVLWIVDLYTTSETYPLSESRTMYNRKLTYRHHAATAYVSGGSAVTVIVPDSILDPVARAWFGKHPGRYITPHLPAALSSPPPVPPAPASGSSVEEQLFRENVGRIYLRMRATLDSGDLRAFGAAFDSLGAVIQGRR